jgi:putative FmdB family regulatory protein
MGQNVWVPIYEYRCSGCGSKISLLVGIHESQETLICPKCGGNCLQRLISKFRHGRNETERLDRIADQLDRTGEPSGSEVREMLRDVGKAMDDDMSEELEEIYEMDQDEEGDD